MTDSGLEILTGFFVRKKGVDLVWFGLVWFGLVWIKLGLRGG